VSDEILIKIENLYKVFGSRPASVMPLVKGGIGKQELLEQHNHVLGLNDINLDIPTKHLQVVMGLSGSGKSTLIRHINRLIEPTAGKIQVGGDDVLTMNPKELREFRRHRISMVFQRFALLPHRTVLENVMYGVDIMGVPKKEAKQRAERWINRVGLAGFEDQYPAKLSGGMQQRVGLARALTTDADILLMDEAFSALDPLIRTDMQNILLDLQAELHKTIVFITHDLDEALKLGDQIAILRDGEVVQQGTAQQIVMRPADKYIMDFVRDINRARVLRVRAVMDAEVKPENPSGGIPAHISLESALHTVAAAGSAGVPVLDKNNQVIGSLNIESLIQAMVPPERPN
jgi:glycine betaine/proline transport system ATP-binding protein